MKGNFYTYFGYGWNNILISGYENGRKFNRKINYAPYIFQPDKQGTFRSVEGVPLRKFQFSNIKSAREYIATIKDGGPAYLNELVYGLTNFPYVYVYEEYKEIEFNPDLLRVGNIDIETDSQDGYGDSQLANREIISITMKVFGKPEVYVLGLKPYETEEKELLDNVASGKYKILYKQCTSEANLLLNFIRMWNMLELDLVTGWNIEMFDIQYIIKRIEKVLGEEHAAKLSPFKKIEKTKIFMWGREFDKYDIIGVPTIDYMAAYRKFRFGNEESYSLGYIANKILKVSKLDYSQYGNLARLYRENHNMFIDYNIIDVLRVEQLDDYLKFIDQIIMIAHFAKVNFADTFGTIRTWDIMIHNYLMDQGIAIPQGGVNEKVRQIAGGYVKEPIAGKYSSVMTYDLTSLYPHLFMMYNISPETYLGKFKGLKEGDSPDATVVQILDGAMEPYRDDMVKHNVTVTGKGTVFSKDKIGFLPKLMKDLFQQRKLYKKKMLQHEADLQDIKAELAKRGIEYDK